jgi:O-antigen ligase
MERAAFTIYLIILLLSIFFFGAVHTYVYTLMTLGVLTATLLVILKSIRKDHRSGICQVRLPRNSLHIVFLVLLCFLVLQLIPLPDFILKLLSPEASVVGEKSLAVQWILNPESNEKPWFSLTLYGYPVRMSIIRFAVYGLFFFGFIHTLNSQKRINVAISLMLLMGCFEALYGLIQTYSGSYHVLWYKMDLTKEQVKGTFINCNHFAAFMAMGVVLAATFAGAIAPERRVSRNTCRRKPSLRSRVASFLEGEEFLFKRILVGLAGVVMGLGLIFSASKGAILSWAGAMFLLGLLLILREKYRRKGALFIGIFLLICGYAVQIGVEYPLERFMKVESVIESRSRYAARTMDLFADFQVAGVGVGNFQYAFPKYQSEKDKKKYYIYAHNDWVQYMAEAGIVGLGLLLGGVAYYIFRTMKLWARRKDAYAVCLGVAPVVALAYIGVHSYVEFTLHTPANVLILLFIMAIGYAALHLERHHRRDRMNYQYYDLPLKYRGGVALVLIFGLIGWTGWWSIKHFMGEAYCNTVPNSTLNRDHNPPLGEVVKAIEWDGGNAEYWYKLGVGLSNLGIEEFRNSKKASADYADEKEKDVSRRDAKTQRDMNGDWLLFNRELEKGGIPDSLITNNSTKRIVKILERAVELNPFDAQYHLRLGWEYAHLWQEKDYHQRWLPAADISMDRAAYFAGVKNPHLHQELGNYWTMRSKSVLLDDPLHAESWAKACWHYQKALALDGNSNRMKKEIKEYVLSFYPDDGFIDQAIRK